MLTAVLAALGAAAGSSISNAMQHQAAGAAPLGKRGAAGLLVHLGRNPRWVFGTLVGLVGFALHGIAVRAGALAIVQPIATSGMVMAILGRSVLDKTLPPVREIGWAFVTACGLTLFVVCANPEIHPVGHESRTGLILVGIGAFAAAALSYAARRQRGENARGLLLGCSAGVLFGMVAGVLKLVANAFADDGVHAVLTRWPLWVLVVIGVSGVVLNQHAFQGSPLSVSMPVLNVVDVLVAVGFGYAVFGEVPAHQPLALVAEVAALLLMAVGIRQLTRELGGTFFRPAPAAERRRRATES